MTEVGIWALKQNASAVAARLERLLDAGRARAPKHDITALPSPEPGPDLSAELAARRDAERY